MRRSTLVAAAIGLLLVAICVGCDFGYDALVAADRSWRFWLSIVAACAINVLGATSLNVVNGMAGQFSIGHAGFIGLGAYAAGVVASSVAAAMKIPFEDLQQNFSFSKSLIVMPPVILAVVVVCAFVGLLVGLPSLRLRGDYLAIVTLGFSEILRLTILGTTEDTAKNPITKAIASLGGSLGYRGPPSGEGIYAGVPSVAGPFWVLGLAIVAVVLAWRIKRSGFGRALRAVREDEIAASAVGVDPARYKVVAFILAAIGAGIAGALLVLRRDGPGIVSPQLMRFDVSFQAIVMVILGGSGSVTGAVFGAVLYTGVFYGSEELLQGLARGEETVVGTDASIGRLVFAIAVVCLITLVGDRARRGKRLKTSGLVALAIVIGLEVLVRTTAGSARIASIDVAALRMASLALSLIVVMLLRPEGIMGERELFERARPRATTPKGTPPSEQKLPGALEA